MIVLRLIELHHRCASLSSHSNATYTGCSLFTPDPSTRDSMKYGHKRSPANGTSVIEAL